MTNKLHLLEGEGKTPKLRTFELDEVLYLRTDMGYVDIVTKQSTDVTATPLKGLEDLLIENGFIRIHRNCLINKKHIVKQHKTSEDGKVTMTIEVTNGDEVDVSRRHHAEMNRYFKSAKTS